MRMGSRYGGARPRRRSSRRGSSDQRDRNAVASQGAVASQTAPPRKIKLPQDITVAQLAERLEVSPTAIIKELFTRGTAVTINQTLDYATASLVVEALGHSVVKEEAKPAAAKQKEDVVFELAKQTGTTTRRRRRFEKRSPVITVMGHVDHGKTSLLDALRETKVAEGEFGGITQRIGAYQVTNNGDTITFIDTPGHEAFTAMRARGAKVTDLAVIVVAADDGVMPQTVEAINHARAAKVPLLIALNKIDLPNANPDRVKQQLTEHEILIEEYGGETVLVEVSAQTKEGLDDLLEMIALLSDIEGVRADPRIPARGVVIESHMDKSRGPVATVLVQEGTLNVGETVVCGKTSGRVRALFNDKGASLADAGPSVPVEILGLGALPAPGETLIVVVDEKAAKVLLQELAERDETERMSLDTLSATAGEGVEELDIIVKADIRGSVEAIQQALEHLSTEETRVRVIYSGVGPVSESDVQLAIAGNALITAFNVRPDTAARSLAEAEKVEIRTYNVIYTLIEEMEKALLGLLEPEFVEVMDGQAEVRAVFNQVRGQSVLGAIVREGTMRRGAQVRVLRNKRQLLKTTVTSLRRFKDAVREVTSGYECGIGIGEVYEAREGDSLETFHIEEKARF
ncbi:MAG: translation initiation factor IF-2 [Chloroflexi bacterium]|nr:translation initiation factor IF-2 [Chloroflexota bacterium]